MSYQVNWEIQALDQTAGFLRDDPMRYATKPTLSVAWTAASSKHEPSRVSALASGPPDISNQLRLTAQADALRQSADTQAQHDHPVRPAPQLLPNSWPPNANASKLHSQLTDDHGRVAERAGDVDSPGWDMGEYSA